MATLLEGTMQRRLAFALIVLLSIPALVFAQVSRGTILGTVKDASGAVIPGVSITVVNDDTGLSRALVTDETGSYSAELLPVGRYRVQAELSGFKKEIRTGIELHVDQKARVDLTLQIGEVSEVLQVDEAVPLVQTEDASLASTMDNRKIIELPLNGRDIAQLAYLIPRSLRARIPALAAEVVVRSPDRPRAPTNSCWTASTTTGAERTKFLLA